MPFRWRVIALLALAACAHEMPPEPGGTSVDTIPIVGPPERLTLNRGKDATPAFTPDGRGIWYAWEKLDRADHDLCLGRLPVGGGIGGFIAACAKPSLSGTMPGAFTAGCGGGGSIIPS